MSRPPVTAFSRAFLLLYTVSVCFFVTRLKTRKNHELHGPSCRSCSHKVTSIVTSIDTWEGETKGGEGRRRDLSSPKDNGCTSNRATNSRHPEATPRHASPPTRRALLPIVQGPPGPRNTGLCVDGEGASRREHHDKRENLVEMTPRQRGRRSSHVPPIITATRLKSKTNSAAGAVPPAKVATTTGAASLPAISPSSCTISTYRNDSNENHGNQGNNDDSNNFGSDRITSRHTDDISTISGCSAVVVRSPSSTTCKAVPAAEAYRSASNTTNAPWKRSTKPRKEPASKLLNCSAGRDRGIQEYSRKGRVSDRGESLSPYPLTISSKRNWTGIRGGGVRRRSRRNHMFVKAGLRDRIEANTNLVNVCPR